MKYSVVYICPGSGQRRTETFTNCLIEVVDGGCLRVSEPVPPNPGQRHIQPNGVRLQPNGVRLQPNGVRVTTTMFLAAGQWYSVRRLPDPLEGELKRVSSDSMDSASAFANIMNAETEAAREWLSDNLGWKTPNPEQLAVYIVMQRGRESPMYRAIQDFMNRHAPGDSISGYDYDRLINSLKPFSQT